jgi:hypothetical protein
MDGELYNPPDVKVRDCCITQSLPSSQYQQASTPSSFNTSPNLAEPTLLAFASAAKIGGDSSGQLSSMSPSNRHRQSDHAHRTASAQPSSSPPAGLQALLHARRRRLARRGPHAAARRARRRIRRRSRRRGVPGPPRLPRHPGGGGLHLQGRRLPLLHGFVRPSATGRIGPDRDTPGPVIPRRARVPCGRTGIGAERAGRYCGLSAWPRGAGPTRSARHRRARRRAR